MLSVVSIITDKKAILMKSANKLIIQKNKTQIGKLKITKNKTTLYQTGFYSTPDRDAWSFEGDKKGEWRQTMSVAFAIITQSSHTPVATSDAKEAKYIKVSDILEKKIEKKVAKIRIIKITL